MPKEYKHKTVAGFFSAHPERWIKKAEEKTKNGVTCFCLLGKARDLRPGSYKLVMLSLRLAIKKLFPSFYNHRGDVESKDEVVVIDFNDSRSRTVDDIIAVAREARV